MSGDPSATKKKVQYITVDSEYVIGVNNNFAVNFGTSSNIFIQEMRNVIGLKLVDFYVTQIASFTEGTDKTNTVAIKYIDILCPDLPDSCQILDERKSKIFARIPLERDFSGTSNIVVNDKQWKSFNRITNYFNPISIKQLNFQMWELVAPQSITSAGKYQLLQPDAEFYMVLEVTTLEYDETTLPQEDATIKVVEAVQSLERKFDTFFEEMLGKEPHVVEKIIEREIVPSDPVPPVPPPIIDNKNVYILIAIIFLLILYMFRK